MRVAFQIFIENAVVINFIHPDFSRSMDNSSLFPQDTDMSNSTGRITKESKIPRLRFFQKRQNLPCPGLLINIPREDLNAIEIAISYERLIDECNLTQDALSERVGKKRTTISNYLRLLKLPAPIQLAIKERKISMGHARAIINIEDPETQYMVFEQIMKYDFSVRKVEEIVRELMKPEEEKERKAERKRQPIEDYMELQTHLARYFDTKVDLKRNEKGRGKIVISFKSDSDLERIVELLDKVDKK